MRVTVLAAGMSFTTIPAQRHLNYRRVNESPTSGSFLARFRRRKNTNSTIQKSERISLSQNFGYASISVCPIWRNGICFGSTIVGNGTCNTPNSGTTPNGTPGQQNDCYAQQLTRLGIGYDLSPDVNFYMELQDSRTWGGNGANGREGTQDDARNHNGCSTANGGGNCGTLGVRAAYMLIRNFAGFQGLSVKAGRQYVVFGNQSLFGAFDWSNTGTSHDGVMLHRTNVWDTYAGWFRTSESDLGQAVPVVSNLLLSAWAHFQTGNLLPPQASS